MTTQPPDGVTPSPTRISFAPDGLPNDPDTTPQPQPAPVPPTAVPPPPPPTAVPPSDPFANPEHNIGLQEALTGKSPNEIRQYLAANPSFADELVDAFDETDNPVFIRALGQLDELALLSGDISGWVVKGLEAVNAPRVAGWKRPDRPPRYRVKLTSMADDLRALDKDSLAALTPENTAYLQGVLELAQRPEGEVIVKALVLQRRL